MADPPPVLTLLVKKGPCEGRTLQGRAGAAALRVGRVVKGNDLAVRDAGASQSHLSVEFLPPPAARWAVTDLGSSNGTLLNGTPLVPTLPTPLSHGDLIKIGESTVLAVSISTDAGPGPGPAAARRSTRKAAAVAAAAAEEEEEEEEQAPAVSRRGGRRKGAAAEAPKAGNEMKEETAVPIRRGGRKKAVEPPRVETEEDEDEEEEEAEEAIPRRGRTRKAAATVALPIQPQNTRSRRAAARRGETVACENDEGEVVRTGIGRGRVTRASARKGTCSVLEEEEEDEVAVARDREGTAVKGDEEEDMAETKEGTSNALEVLPVAGRGRAKRARRGRGRATRASSRNAEDAIIVNDGNEQEERDMADDREHRGSSSRVLAANDGCKEDKVATGDGKLDGTSKASMKNEKMVEAEEEDEALTERGIEGRDNAQHAPADNGGVEEEVKNLSRGGENEIDQELGEKVLPESKLDGIEEVKENDKSRDRTSNASEVSAARRGRAKRARGGRGRATRAGSTKAEDAIIGNTKNEQEGSDMADGGECGESPLKMLAANDSCEEDKVATGDDKLDGTSKGSMTDVEEDVTLTEREIEGRVNAQHAPSDNGGVEEEEVNLRRVGENEVDQELREKVLLDSKVDGVGELEENDKREAIGASGEKGDVGERTGRCSLENMTLGEWFVQIEKYLLAKNEEAAEKAIVEVQEKHRRFFEYLKTLKKCSAPS